MLTGVLTRVQLGVQPTSGREYGAGATLGLPLAALCLCVRVVKKRGKKYEPGGRSSLALRRILVPRPLVHRPFLVVTPTCTASTRCDA